MQNNCGALISEFEIRIPQENTKFGDSDFLIWIDSASTKHFLSFLRIKILLCTLCKNHHR